MTNRWALLPLPPFSTHLSMSVVAYCRMHSLLHVDRVEPIWRCSVADFNWKNGNKYVFLEIYDSFLSFASGWKWGTFCQSFKMDVNVWKKCLGATKSCHIKNLRGFLFSPMDGRQRLQFWGWNACYCREAIEKCERMPIKRRKTKHK